LEDNIMADATYTPKNERIFSGIAEKNGKAITVKSGQGELAIGTILIALTADAGEYTKIDLSTTPPAVDKQTIVILSDDIDATSEAVDCIGYRTGQFDENYLLFTGDMTEAWRNELRAIGIILNEGAINAL